MREPSIGQLTALIKAVKDMGGYESTREQLAAAIGEKDPNNVLVTGNVQSDWLLELSFRIDALEQRIEKIDADMFAHHAIAMNHSDSIEAMWRKLNHKGGNE